MAAQFNIPFTLCGVQGVITRVPKEGNLWRQQKFTARRDIKWDGKKAYIGVEVRFDDECSNGHNTFAITGHIQIAGERDWDVCGCIHEEVAKYFPELKHLIQWHGVSSDGPLHYIANTIFHASDRDCWGRRKGEPSAWQTRIRFGQFPMSFPIKDSFAKWLQVVLEHQERTAKSNPSRRQLMVTEVPYTGGAHSFGPNYSFDDYTDKWHECPFETRQEAEEFKAAMNWGPEVVKVPTQFSEGKERDLDAARSCANWPEATDEQLCLPKDELTKLLEARLPELLEAFKNDIVAAGFAWEPTGE